MRIGYDSLNNLSSIPWQPGDLIFAYINGRVSSNNYNEARSLFPKAQILSITTNGDINAKADICDCETGDYTPQRAADWRIAGSGSTIYASRDTWPTVRNLIPASLPTSWFAATLDGTTNVPGSVAVQYRDTGLYDITIITDDLWFPSGGIMPSQALPTTAYPLKSVDTLVDDAGQVHVWILGNDHLYHKWYAQDGWHGPEVTDEAV